MSWASLTSCSKNLSSRVLSPGLLPAPSNSSLYSCKKTLQEDIPKPQSPPSSAAFLGPVHQMDTSATMPGQQEDTEAKSLPCAHVSIGKGVLLRLRLKAIPCKTEKVFVSSVSLSYPFSEVCSAQSHIITLSLQGGCTRYRPLHVQTGAFEPGPCAHKHWHMPWLLQQGDTELPDAKQAPSHTQEQLKEPRHNQACPPRSASPLRLNQSSEQPTRAGDVAHHFLLKMGFHPQPARERLSLLPHRYLKGLVVSADPTPWDGAHRARLVSLSPLLRQPRPTGQWHARQTNSILAKQSTGPTVTASLPTLSIHKFPQIPEKL